MTTATLTIMMDGNDEAVHAHAHVGVDMFRSQDFAAKVVGETRGGGAFALRLVSWVRGCWGRGGKRREFLGSC